MKRTFTHLGSACRSMREAARLALALTACLIALVMAGGCASSQVATLPNPVDIDVTEYDRLFEASVQVLRDRGYRIDRQDHRFGVITTHPRKSPTLAEPWHRDNTTVSQMLESTSNHLRRRVQIRLIPGQTPRDDAQAASQDGAAGQPAIDGYLFETQVVLEQIETPRRFLTGSTRPTAMFGQYRQPPAELARQGIDADYWWPVGRDESFEQALAAQILRRSVELARTPRRDAAGG